MSQDTNLKSLEALEASGIALATANKIASAINREKKAAAQLAPGVVAALVDARLIQDHERAAAATKLASHDGAVEVIGNLISYFNQQKLAYEQKLLVNGQGQPVEKASQASGNGHVKKANPNYLGRRMGAGERSAADMALINGLGLGGALNLSE